MLSQAQLNQFTHQGFVRLDNAFPDSLAAACRSILWRDTGYKANDPSTWTQPVVRLGDYTDLPFRQAANTPQLHAAFNQLVGEGRWLARTSMGSFPIRFPSATDPGDTGWHVDASYAGENPHDYFSWRINVRTKGRALLMLFLFSDVEDNDAPTRIRIGSHLEVARILEPAKETGLSFVELASHLQTTEGLPEVTATGKAGTVYLCHPFLVHAAQPHHGKNPRFMAQPPLVSEGDYYIDRPGHSYFPLEKSIRIGLGLEK